MFNRFLRLLTVGINAYSFYSNPVRFFATLFSLLLIPYLTYILWGSILIIILAILGAYFLYKVIQTSLQIRSTYH